MKCAAMSCYNLKSLRNVLHADNAEDPASTPVYWISKWVDYSDKYGLGYQLCDNSVGVLYNDATRLLLNGNGETLQYTARDGTEGFYTLKGHPEDLKKKVTLLQFFLSYMKDHLIKVQYGFFMAKPILISTRPRDISLENILEGQDTLSNLL